MNDNVKVMPMLVTRGVIVFPNTLVQLDVIRQKSKLALNSAIEIDRNIFITAQRDISQEEPGIENIHHIGCVATVKQVVKLPNDDNVHIVVEGLYRAEIVQLISDKPYFEVAVSECHVVPSRLGEIKYTALLRKLRETFNEYAMLSSKLSPDVLLRVLSEDNVCELSDCIASSTPIPWEDKQFLLEQSSERTLAEQLLIILARECEIQTYENQIKDKVQKNLEENHRDYYLREQIKVLNEELYGYDDVDEIEEYKLKVSDLNAPESVKEKLYKEVDKLSKMPQGAHEATVIYNYLDYCLSLPWLKCSEENIELEQSRKFLDSAHYGMEKVKERIIEMIAVRKLRSEQNGQILCLAGPPGVGKTSIASSIADCLGRKLSRISLGGIKDESEIRGHRRTYIGAMAGRIIDAISSAGVSNPVILLDEIDKIGSDFKGDCSASLLEALDPEQNSTFRDHYIDMPYDLSKVLFITTANDTSNIPAPLYDRMEIVELSSYTREEKFHIAKGYLVKKQIKNNGLTNSNFKLSDAAIYYLIDFYTRESGVRSLERQIGALCRKAACAIVANTTKTVRINAKDIQNYLGPKKVKADDLTYKGVEIGVVNGLAWTSVGGEIMRLEAAAFSGTGKIELTGSLGNVMQESAKTAISYIRTISDNNIIPSDFYKTMDIHVHATESAVPKDGPSAGITMAVAVLSALTGIPVRSDVAMTGEISLRGKVLAIGGLKEKTMAAYKAGIKNVIIPEQNKPDLDEIEPIVKESLNFIFCKDMQQVLNAALKTTQPLKRSSHNSTRAVSSCSSPGQCAN